MRWSCSSLGLLLLCLLVIMVFSLGLVLLAFGTSRAMMALVNAESVEGAARDASEDSDRQRRLDEIREQYKLTDRETQILSLLSKGHSAKRIAEMLYISVSTVQGHIKRIYAKMGIHSRQSAINLFEGTTDSEEAVSVK